MSLTSIRNSFKQASNKEHAAVLQRFFKTGPGEYGEGDVFIGIKVPTLRKISKGFYHLTLDELNVLLKSPIHEERLTSLFILVKKFEKGNQKERKNIFKFYIKNTKKINNWDLVDLSAPNIVGEYLTAKDHDLLFKLASSKNLWERRIAIMATFQFIKSKQFDTTFRIAEMLLDDKHDLIHKAVGWMLREIGKRDLAAEENFLLKFYKKMPRTMLRYAIEKFPEKKRLAYLKGNA
jgi:3-methyladenine DNA glycosylase AlkD